MNNMRFDYETYFRQNFVIPSILILFCLFLIASVLFKNVFRFHFESTKTFLRNIVKLSLFFLVVAFLISVNIPP